MLFGDENLASSELTVCDFTFLDRTFDLPLVLRTN